MFKCVKCLSDLKVGDIVKGKSSRKTYVVTCNYGNRVTAVRSVDITNPDEWEVIREVKNQKQE